MTALIGSTTRKYTTASTRTLTLSLVMPSWAGTAMAMICMLTFCSLSPMGRMMVSPGPRVSGRTLPNRKISPLVLLHYPHAAADDGQPADNENDENHKERCEHGNTPFLPLRAAKA